MDNAFIVLIFGAVIALIGILYNLDRKDDSNSSLKKLTPAGRWVALLGILMTFVSGIDLYKKNEASKAQIKQDSIRHSQIVSQDSIIIEKNSTIIEKNEMNLDLTNRLLSKSDSLNLLLKEKLYRQEVLLKEQSKEIEYAKLVIRDDFNCGR